MKNKFFNLLLTVLLLNYCTAPSYIPKSEKLDISPYGSYIVVSQHDGPTIRGELISIDNDYIIVLQDFKAPSDTVRSFSAIDLPMKSVSGFTLTYAQPVNYSWSIFVYSLLTITHGFFLLLSFPVNLIVTISVTAGGSLSYQYSNNTMTFENLKMFARFPQGLPTGINIKDLKR
jgi:hypothetical protein